MRRFNGEVGYARADQILLEVGEKLQGIIKEFNISSGSVDDNMAMLFRKGADYLIYSEFEGERLDNFIKQLKHKLNYAMNENGLDIRFVTRLFDKNKSAEDALNEIFMGEIKPGGV